MDNIAEKSPESPLMRHAIEAEETVAAFESLDLPPKVLRAIRGLAGKVKHLVNAVTNLQKQNRELHEKLEGFPPPEPEPAPSAFLTNRLRMHLHRVSDSLADYVNLPPSTLSDAVRLNALLVKVSALHEAFMHLEEKGRPY
jgi:hypothetical protein